MQSAILIIFAVCLGFCTWWVVLMFKGLPYPFGQPGFFERVIFYSPVLGYFLPSAFQAFRSGRIVTGAWLVASAPIAGILNAIPALLCFIPMAIIFDDSTVASIFAAIVLIGIWGRIFLRIVSPRQVPANKIEG